MEAAFVREQEEEERARNLLLQQQQQQQQHHIVSDEESEVSEEEPTAITEHAASITYEVGPAIDRGGISMLRTAAARRPHFSSFCMTLSARLQAYNAPWAIVLGLFGHCPTLYTLLPPVFYV
ncbi:hypothetical protein CISG_00089 [Coccidioides immitis RMSCC 3703]|uniref:Uncharacterized protein n=1 Tax=Coccidioides immitis RMSCC 3703 TaxID=454286 RepID=A0A0J8QHF0_COCIT|nr:hypothetical protein CISG_00089 [Coccidioides immitis RMSCC 3703]